MGLWPKKERGDLLGISIPSPFLLFLFLSRGVFGTRAGSKYGEGGKKEEMERRPFSDRHLPEGKYGPARRTTDTSRLFGECKKKVCERGNRKEALDLGRPHVCRIFEATSMESQILFFPNLGSVYGEGHEFRGKGRGEKPFDL